MLRDPFQAHRRFLSQPHRDRYHVLITFAPGFQFRPFLA
jgi:hypothetical protein